MANYNTLITSIQDNIKQNGQNLITGELLQQALLSMIAELGAEFQIGGVAEPTDNPGIPDYKVAYFAATPGTYYNFDSLSVEDGEIAILKYSGGWQKETIISANSRWHTAEPTKNIFSKQGIIFGAINANGVVIPSETYRCTDFLPVDGSSTYAISVLGAPRSVNIVAFYQNGIFISRVTGNVSKFDTPANCTHIRVSSTSFYADGVLLDWCISKDGIIPYVPSRKLYDVGTCVDGDVKQLNYAAFGMYKYVEYADIKNIIINAANLWLQNLGARVFLLPVSEGQTIKLTNNNLVGTVYAFLKSNTVLLGTSPEFVYKYNQIVNEVDGSITWELVTDEHGDPVLDQRRVLPIGGSVVETVPPETKYFYLIAVTPVSGVTFDSLPAHVSIDGVVLNERGANGANGGNDMYDTVFFDDFDGELNTDVWIRHAQTPASGGRYNSRFKTDKENAYTDQGCLVLRCSKTATAEDGTYIDHNGQTQPVQYIAPYVSTGDSLACPAGRISARMKCSKGMVDGIFPACFWTFGQNNAWPYAHEMDIAETSASISTEDKVASDGTPIPAGSHLSAFAIHTHARSEEVADVFRQKLLWITWILYNAGEPTGDVLEYIRNVDISDWHTYTVEWDENTIAYSIDGRPLIGYSAEELGAIDADGNIGFHYPQDIRFNIKAGEASIDQDCFLYIDWVRAESKNLTPCTSIAHDDVTIAKNTGLYINPVFNVGCSNRAYTIDIGNTGLYTGVINPSGGTPKVIHPTDGEIAAQGNTIYIMSNGDMYVLDSGELKKCDIRGNILSGGGEPLTDYTFGYNLDNGVIAYRKYNSQAAAQVQHRIVGTHVGTANVTLRSANGRSSCEFSIVVTS